ncbi:hypothetical protein JXA56_05280 [Candidatus Micrarchaeota archaeon]|nr:hypothetical protein [Candidatus Micrarchaeota archaeon]
MKLALLILLLMPLAFAWQGLAVAAMTTSVIILALIYMVGFGFGVNELQMMAKEEMFQIIAVAVLIVALTGTDGILNAISTSDAFIETPGDTGATMQSTAKDIAVRWRGEITGLFTDIRNLDIASSREGSKGSQCNIAGMGYSVSGCGGYSMLATPLSMAGGIVGFAIGELSAIERLILVSETYALAFLLPFGIVLRTLKFTRGAGGLLIALGISLHILLPAGIIFTDMLGQTFIADERAQEYLPQNYGTVDFDCNPGDTRPEGWAGNLIMPLSIATFDPDLFSGQLMTNNEINAINGYTTMRENIRKYLYSILVLATLGPVISLMMVAGGIKALTSIAGAEVDVSAISRFV